MIAPFARRCVARSKSFMLVFILRRLAQAVVVMLTVAFIAFMLFQYVGDPVTNLLGRTLPTSNARRCAGTSDSTSPFPFSSPGSPPTRLRVNSASA